MRIRVVLAEDNALLRDGVCRLIESQPDLELAGAASDYDSLIATVDATRPDVVLTDIRMPPTGTDEGIRAATILHATHPAVGVVVLSQYAEPSFAVRLLEHGSEGRAYLLKERISDVDQLLGAIREVARGGSVIDSKIVEALVGAKSRTARSELDRLTRRESEVLAEMAQGRSNAAIGGALYLSEKAVEKHITAIFARLGLSAEKDVNQRVKAVLLYLSQHSA
jgi:DNA-binding NarL/FixJ family response regulator